LITVKRPPFNPSEKTRLFRAAARHNHHLSPTTHRELFKMPVLKKLTDLMASGVSSLRRGEFAIECGGRRT
jgi:hypothetical protein